MPSRMPGIGNMVVVTLTTDFGYGPYVAVMKGIILSMNPAVRIVDISHSITPQCVLEGAYVLDSTVIHFRSGENIHLGVVDPGVGTGRKPLVFKCEKGILVGPDNGLLSAAAESLGIISVHELANKAWRYGKHSATFHGRDVFAPAVGHLSKGAPADSAGPEVKDWVKLDVRAHERRADEIRSTIVHVDHFGNIVTSVPGTSMPPGIKELELVIMKDVEEEEKVGEKDRGRSKKANKARTAERLTVPFVSTYSDVPKGALACLVNSHGHVEIAVNGGDASEMLGTVPGMAATLKF